MDIASAKNEKKRVKPFLKWAGGKSQLLPEIEKYYPFANSSITKYAEPFVGGGAVLFDILSKYDLDEVYISDVNAELINTYRIVQTQIELLIHRLNVLQDAYLPLSKDERRSFYSSQRERYNDIKLQKNQTDDLEKAALMIFLNRTCFNGLYRVNKKGQFNVPIGDYKNPLICDEDNLRAASIALRKVHIVCADYHDSDSFIDSHTFVYFDPPYRPLTATASFTSYTENEFGDQAQIELADFVTKMRKKGALTLSSNSDPQNANAEDRFFDDLYSLYCIKRVEASRMINSKRDARGKIRELLISSI